MPVLSPEISVCLSSYYGFEVKNIIVVKTYTNVQNKSKNTIVYAQVINSVVGIVGVVHVVHK